MLTIESVCWKQDFDLKKSTVFSLQLQKHNDIFEKRSSSWKLSPVSNRWRYFLQVKTFSWLFYLVRGSLAVLFRLPQLTFLCHLSLAALFQRILWYTLQAEVPRCARVTQPALYDSLSRTQIKGEVTSVLSSWRHVCLSLAYDQAASTCFYHGRWQKVFSF